MRKLLASVLALALLCAYVGEAQAANPLLRLYQGNNLQWWNGSAWVDPSSMSFQASGNGATKSTSPSDRSSHQLSLLDDFQNVYGDAIWYLANVACTASSPVITLTVNGSNPTPALTSADVGKVFDAPGCGGVYWAYGPVTIISPGAGYIFGETVTFANGLQGRVVGTTASGGLASGAAASVIIVNPGSFSGAAPTNDFVQVSSSGGGTGLEISVGGFNSALSGTIQSVNAATQQITLNVNATRTQAATQQLIVYGHDDEPGILAALTSVAANARPGGAKLRLPTPSGMGYLFASMLTLPAGQATITGDDLNSVIVAGAPMQALITTPTPGGTKTLYTLEHFVLEGATVAVHDFWQQKQYPVLDHMWLYDAASGGSNYATTSAGTYVSGTLENSWVENQTAYYATVNQLPSIVEETYGSDGVFFNNQLIRSSYAEIWDGSGNGGLANKHISEHPYGASSNGTSTVPAAQYNAVSAGAGYFQSNELDTAQLAGIFVPGFGSMVSGNKCILNTAVASTEPACVTIGQNIASITVIGNNATSPFTDVVVQANSIPSTTTVVIGNTGGTNTPYSYVGSFRANTMSVFAVAAVPGLHPTVGGTCAANTGTLHGGYSIGEIAFTGACSNGTISLTFPSGIAGFGWTCAFRDITTPANTWSVTGRSTTSATMTGTATSGDNVQFSCEAY